MDDRTASAIACHANPFRSDAETMDKVRIASESLLNLRRPDKLRSQFIVELKDRDSATIPRFELFEEDEPEFLGDASCIDLETTATAIFSTWRLDRSPCQLAHCT